MIKIVLSNTKTEYPVLLLFSKYSLKMNFLFLFFSCLAALLYFILTFFFFLRHQIKIMSVSKKQALSTNAEVST